MCLVASLGVTGPPRWRGAGRATGRGATLQPTDRISRQILFAMQGTYNAPMLQPPATLRLPLLRAACLVLLLALGPYTLTHAQEFVVSPQLVAPGGTLQATGSDLEPGAVVVLTLTDPAGSRRSVQLEADAAGRIRYATRLNELGEWQLSLEAPERSESFVVTVASAEDAPPPEAAETEVKFEERDLVARVAGDRLWLLHFPPGSGPIGDVLALDDRAYAGIGNSVLELDVTAGTVDERWIVSGPVADLSADEPDDDAILAVTVARHDGIRERFTITPEGVEETVRFGTAPEVFDWLKTEAAVPDAAERLERDPTNPWLYLELPALRLTDDPVGAREQLRGAIVEGRTFYDLAGVSHALETAGQRDLAREAFDAAMFDFAARGYEPALLRDQDLAKAYRFPLEPFRQALADNDLSAAEFWAERLVVATPRVPGAEQALNAYAARLVDMGEEARASFWRREAARLNTIGGARGLEAFTLVLARNGWGNVLALLLASIALHLTLIAKYWTVQGEDLARSRRGHLARLFAIRYYGFAEKLVLVALYALILAFAGLAMWAERGRDMPLQLRSGTLANAEARSYLATADWEGTRADFIRGYAAQVAGERDVAARHYEAAGDYPAALNNLGALLGDESFYQRAVGLQDLPEARYNLGRQTRGFVFHERYRPAQPVLAVPHDGDFQQAMAGDWEASVARAFANPWRTFAGAEPWGLPSWAFQVLLVLFLAVAVLTALLLLWFRPRKSRRARRTSAYHLLALLVPGSGEADEAWGLLLIVPWALLSGHLLSRYLGWNYDLGFAPVTAWIVLGVIYVVNTVAFGVEFLAYRRRLKGFN